MGFLSGIMGNATELSEEQLLKEFADVFVGDETIEKSFQVIRDIFIFTNKRLVLIDKQGISGKKCEILTIPYGSITYFSIQTAGAFDLDSELKIMIRGVAAPLVKQFKKGTDLVGLQRVLAKHVLK